MKVAKSLTQKTDCFGLAQQMLPGRLIVFCLSLVLLLWSSCGISAPADTKGLGHQKFENVVFTDLTSSNSIGSIDFVKCRVNDPSKTFYRDMECGSLDVAEDYNNPDGKKITLFIARLKTLSKKPKPEPLVLIEGGPGGAPSESFITPGRGFDKVLQERDIFLIDQRGTGKSNPLRCPESGEIGTIDLRGKEGQKAAECLAKLSAGVKFYTTSIAVQDLDEVRKALGIVQWNMYGVSYGSRVALHYLRRFPEAVRTLIVDGVVYPELNLGPDIALQSERALRQLTERCAQSPDCSAQYPNLQAGIESLFEKLSISPATVEIDRFDSGRKDAFEFSKMHLAAIIRLALYSPANAAILPVVLQAAYKNNNFAPIARNAIDLTEMLNEAISVGMHNSVVCTEDLPYIDKAQIDTSALNKTYMGSNIIDSLLAICEVWPEGVIDPDFKTPVASDIPVLLLSGSADPITPPEYADKAAVKLTNSKHIVAQGQGHGIAGLGCVPTLIAKFIDSATLENLDASCLEKQEPAPFFIDFNGPSA